MERKTVVTGVIGSDCHVVGNWMLRHALERAGFAVVALGAAVSQEEFIDAAKETHADAILVSSIYGHAPLDCQGFREKCVEAGLKKIVLYVGGLLSASVEPFEETEKRFRAMGFDRVYSPHTGLDKAISDLKTDLALV